MQGRQDCYQKRLPELGLWTNFSPIQTLSQVCFSTFCDMKQGVLQTSGLLGFPPQITVSYPLSERDTRKATGSKDQKETLSYINSSNVSMPCISEWQDTLPMAYPFLMDPVPSGWDLPPVVSAQLSYPQVHVFLSFKFSLIAWDEHMVTTSCTFRFAG